MPQPEVDNKTPFAAEAIFINDEEFAPVVTTVVKATFDIIDNNRLRLADEQEGICLAGEYWGDPETSSYKYEPECALFKPATDIVLIGQAHAENDNTRMLDVGMRLKHRQLGNIQKKVRVFGDRQWVSGPAAPQMTQPLPFQSVPLIYERAFGGRDPRADQGERVSMEPRNPIGMGYRDPSQEFEEGALLPNIEDPANLIQSYKDRPAPAGFGFISAHWQPRVQLAGTYDDEWDQHRKPLLAKDFNRKYFNAASPGLIVDGFLNGDEEVNIINASDRGPLAFYLPGMPAPICVVRLHNGDPIERMARLDTLIINTDEHRVFLLWRNCVNLPGGHLNAANIKLYVPGVDILKPAKQA